MSAYASDLAWLRPITCSNLTVEASYLYLNFNPTERRKHKMVGEIIVLVIVPKKFSGGVVGVIGEVDFVVKNNQGMVGRNAKLYRKTTMQSVSISLSGDICGNRNSKESYVPCRSRQPVASLVH